LSDPLPPPAALPLVRGRRERSERGGRSQAILIPVVYRKAIYWRHPIGYRRKR
jgi:hypothetical protein